MPAFSKLLVAAVVPAAMVPVAGTYPPDTNRKDSAAFSPDEDNTRGVDVVSKGSFLQDESQTDVVKTTIQKIRDLVKELDPTSAAEVLESLKGEDIAKFGRSTNQQQVMAVDANGDVEAAGNAASGWAGPRKKNRGGGGKKKKASGSGSSQAAKVAQDEDFMNVDDNGGGLTSYAEIQSYTHKEAEVKMHKMQYTISDKDGDGPVNAEEVEAGLPKDAADPISSALETQEDKHTLGDPVGEAACILSVSDAPCLMGDDFLSKACCFKATQGMTTRGYKNIQTKWCVHNGTGYQLFKETRSGEPYKSFKTSNTGYNESKTCKTSSAEVCKRVATNSPCRVQGDEDGRNCCGLPTGYTYDNQVYQCVARSAGTQFKHMAPREWGAFLTNNELTEETVETCTMEPNIIARVDDAFGNCYTKYIRDLQAALNKHETGMEVEVNCADGENLLLILRAYDVKDQIRSGFVDVQKFIDEITGKGGDDWAVYWKWMEAVRKKVREIPDAMLQDAATQIQDQDTLERYPLDHDKDPFEIRKEVMKKLDEALKGVQQTGKIQQVHQGVTMTPEARRQLEKLGLDQAQGGVQMRMATDNQILQFQQRQESGNGESTFPADWDCGTKCKAVPGYCGPPNGHLDDKKGLEDCYWRTDHGWRQQTECTGFYSGEKNCLWVPNACVDLRMGQIGDIDEDERDFCLGKCKKDGVNCKAK